MGKGAGQTLLMMTNHKKGSAASVTDGQTPFSREDGHQRFYGSGQSRRASVLTSKQDGGDQLTLSSAASVQKQRWAARSQ